MSVQRDPRGHGWICRWSDHGRQRSRQRVPDGGWASAGTRDGSRGRKDRCVDQEQLERLGQEPMAPGVSSCGPRLDREALRPQAQLRLAPPGRGAAATVGRPPARSRLRFS